MYIDILSFIDLKFLMSPEKRELYLIIWLILSSFGIMFAILSWIQEAGYLPDVESLGMWKGVIALITGLILYWFLAREITGEPNDK